MTLLLFSPAAGPQPVFLKVLDGEGSFTPAPLMRFDGADWVSVMPEQLKRFDGATWQTI